MTNPESGTVRYIYDNNGNVLTRTDARSITTTIAYDVLNRPTSKTYSDGTPNVATGELVEVSRIPCAESSFMPDQAYMAVLPALLKPKP